MQPQMTNDDYHKILKDVLPTDKVEGTMDLLSMASDAEVKHDMFMTVLRVVRAGTLEPLYDTQVYKGQVVSIESFINEDYYLGKKSVIYPEVMKSLIELNSGKYIEAILTGGIGSAKTTISHYTIAYQLYVLSRMRQPHAMFNLDPASEIMFIFQSLSMTLAKNLEFNRFKALLEDSEYFMRDFTFDKDIESRLKFPHRIEVVPVSGAESATIGQNVMGGVLDEINYMAVVEKSKADVDGGTYNQAWALYNSIARRRKSRFLVNGVTYGMLCLVSSKRYPGQFTDVKEDEAHKQIEITGKTNIFLYDKCVWDIKPPGTYDNTEWFYVFIGDESRQPMVLTDDEYSRMSDDDILAYVRKIPDEYKMEFERDIINALREVAGVSTLAKHPYMPNIAKISGCFAKTESVFNAPTAVLGSGQLQILVKVVAAAGMASRFVHIDLSKSGDSTGFVVGHVDRFIDLDRGDVVEVLPRVVIDGALEIRSPRFGEISYTGVRKILYTLRDMGMPIKWVTFDSYQSVDSIQILKNKGFVCGIQSMDTSIVPYQVLKAALYDGRVVLPEHKLLYDELRGLEFDPEKTKVDHPASGCFTGDTMVHTKDGDKSFERLVVEHNAGKENLVMTYDEDLDEFSYVSAVKPHVTKEVTVLYDFEMEDGSTFSCTGDHHILLSTGWCRAYLLCEGDDIFSMNTKQQQLIRMLKMRIKKVTKRYSSPTPVYDLSVHITENFCLANGCVVHNSKDVADALAGVVYGLTVRREIWLQHGITREFIPASLLTQISSEED